MIHLDGSGGVAEAIPRVAELLGCDATCVYSVAEGEVGLELARFDQVGFPSRFLPLFSRFLAAAPRRFGLYDVGRPEPQQRNRVIESTQRVDHSQPQAAMFVERVFAPAGMVELRHLRVLLCEGSSLLGWFGALQIDPYAPRHARVLRALSRPFHRRLLADRRLGRGRLALAALDATLEAIALPALVVAGRGRVREANAAARRLLATRNRDVRASIADAIAGRAPALPVQLVPLREIDRPWIVNHTPLNREVGEIDFRLLEAQLEDGRRRGADFIIAQLHWGMEFELYPRAAQVAVAHRIAELGADAIIGHHPHVAQPVEYYRSRRDADRVIPIFYSLGNLTTPFSVEFMRRSGVAQLELARGTARDGSTKTYVATAGLDHVEQVVVGNQVRLRPAT